MKSKLLIIFMVSVVLMGCVSSPDKKEIDRGTIPNPTNPIKPPSLTNEFDMFEIDNIMIDQEEYNEFIRMVRK